MNNPTPLPLVAIVGRPNVGKSRLFNRILGTRTAIVDDVPGVTRDRILAECSYQGRAFQMVDTGGLDLSASEEIPAQITRQAELAITEADLLIVVMDGRAGLTPLDEEIAGLVRGIKKPVVFAINKIDNPKSEPLLSDFYKLGQSEIFPVSAEHGTGVDELLEFLLPNFLQVDPDYIAPVHPRIAVVGRPNVGKSTLINILIGEERVVVSHQPGTTRDSVDTLVTYKGQSYVFTDTAGIRRRGKIDRGIEGYSVARALRALGRSDVAVLMLDGVEGVTEQDTKIAGLIQKQGRGCLILVNKWDLQIRKHKSQAEYMCELRRLFPFLSFVPIVFGSAITPQTIGKIFPHIDTVMAEFSKRIPTGQLNQFLQRALEKNPIPMRRAQPMKSVYFTQVAIKPPTFVLFVKRPEDIPLTYFRYLENALRDNYGFVGTPIRILTRGK